MRETAEREREREREKELATVTAKYLCLIFLAGVLQLAVSLHTELVASCGEDEDVREEEKMKGGRREKVKRRERRGR